MLNVSITNTQSDLVQARLAVLKENYAIPEAGERVLLLASYAAFPLTLTSHLMYCLREEFVPDCPWYGIGDILLSPLCETIGYDLYEMSPQTRNALLENLLKHRGTAAFDALEVYLLEYIQSRLQIERSDRPKRLGDDPHPQWVSMIFTRGVNEGVEAIRATLLERVKDKSLPKNRMKLASLVDSYARLPILEQFQEQLFDWAKSTAEGHSINAIELNQIDGFPPIQRMEFEETVLRLAADVLEKMVFQTVKVDRFGKVIDRPNCEAYYFEEALGNDVAPLKMIAIRSGRFLMGSPEDEEGRSKAESPQHWVTVPPFFMSETPVTQEQWRFIAKQPKVEIDLEINPRFKGDRLPIERVTWHEAVEFCQRLSAFTRRQEYRLPTEAEWEYACRAGTTTPFAFGETITTELANFNGADTYGSAPTGSYRSKTTDLGSFEPNAFGLVDMHGNVWEWCQDRWHDRYDGAPVDGSAWESGNYERRILRGGSWIIYPWYCRSANRYGVDPGLRYDDLGFRVVCALPRTS